MTLNANEWLIFFYSIFSSTVCERHVQVQNEQKFNTCGGTTGESDYYHRLSSHCIIVGVQEEILWGGCQ